MLKKSGRGLTPGNIYKQEKDKRERGAQWGTYRNKMRKRCRGAYTKGHMETRKREAKGGGETGKRIETRKRKAGGGLTP